MALPGSYNTWPNRRVTRTSWSLRRRYSRGGMLFRIRLDPAERMFISMALSRRRIGGIGVRLGRFWGSNLPRDVRRGTLRELKRCLREQGNEFFFYHPVA